MSNLHTLFQPQIAFDCKLHNPRTLCCQCLSLHSWNGFLTSSSKRVTITRVPPSPPLTPYPQPHTSNSALATVDAIIIKPSKLCNAIQSLYAVIAPNSMTIRVMAVILIGISPPVFANEVQDHGLWFERWLCDTFFEGYRPSQYTQKWDIPLAANSKHGHLPVNPKATKLGATIGLGDALRQFDIALGTESFILIVGFWKQTEPSTKTWVNTQVVTVSPQQWRKLWHPITRIDLEKLDAVVKDKARTQDQARLLAQAIKSQPPFSLSIIQVNPKIDRSQRRLQCSLRFNALFDNLLPGVSREPQNRPAIWGIPVPNATNTAARKLNK